MKLKSYRLIVGDQAGDETLEFVAPTSAQAIAAVQKRYPNKTVACFAPDREDLIRTGPNPDPLKPYRRDAEDPADGTEL